MANHKLEKIEILNQKSERVQIKKDADLLRDVEMQVKKEVKMAFGNSKGQTAPLLQK